MRGSRLAPSALTALGVVLLLLLISMAPAYGDDASKADDTKLDGVAVEATPLEGSTNVEDVEVPDVDKTVDVDTTTVDAKADESEANALEGKADALKVQEPKVNAPKGDESLVGVTAAPPEGGAASALGPPTTVNLEPDTAERTVGTEHCVTATVSDASGNVLKNIKVFFTVTGANSASGNDTTKQNGPAKFCYTGNSVAADTIKGVADANGNNSAEATEPTDTVTAAWVAGGAATLTLVPKTSENPIGTKHCVTATVADASGNRVKNLTVIFTVTGVHSDNGTDKTNNDGQASFCYTGTNVGEDTITAVADANKNGSADATEPKDTATNTWVASGPATLTLDPKTSERAIGTEHCVTATVRDASGNPNKNVKVVVDVTGAHSKTGDGKTDKDGQAKFCYTGSNVGEDVIKAFADTNEDGDQETGEPQDLAAATWIAGVPGGLTLTPKQAEKPIGTEHCVTATVKDTSGNPVKNVRVFFEVIGANEANDDKKTDKDGNAEFCYTGNDVGQDAITAFADTNDNGDPNVGEPGDAATATWIPGAPGTLTLQPKTAENPIGTKHCLTATVTDASGNFVKNIKVFFTVAGAHTESGDKKTDKDGNAEFCYTGNNVGADNITAFADTNDDGNQDVGEPGDTATATWIAGAATKVTLFPKEGEHPVGEEHCVVATVTDASGNFVKNVDVFFTVGGANSANGNDKTKNDGTANFCYTGNNAGEDAIVAVADADKDGADLLDPSDVASNTYTPEDGGGPDPDPEPDKETARIRITKMHFEPSDGDERVIIRNKGNKDKSLKGWTLSDQEGRTYTFGRFTLEAGKSVRVHTGKGDDDSNDVYWGRKKPTWDNDGDTATLRNRRGKVKDTCSYRRRDDSPAKC